MNRVHIVGRKNSGKTTLIVELVGHLTERGFRVGTIKHTHHQHQLDTPGKDSHRHSEAGAAVVGVLTPGMTAVFQATESDRPERCRYTVMTPMFTACDLVLVEGDHQTRAPKVEVWRADLSHPPIGANDSNISAIVSDDRTDASLPIWARSEITTVADGILKLVPRINSV